MTNDLERVTRMAEECGFVRTQFHGSDDYFYQAVADHILAFEQAVLAKQSAEIERLKSVPMKYRRLEFNAQLQKEIESLQAKIDALMLEYCPDEMSQDQVETWKLSQRKVGV